MKPWFHTGYEFYIDPSRRRSLGLAVTCEEQNVRAIDFLKHFGDEQFFLFVHYWDPHTPYLPPDKFRKMFYDGDTKSATDPSNRSLEGLWKHPLGKAWRDTWFKALGGNITDSDYVDGLYDASIRYNDDGIAALLQALDDTGQADDTLVVFMGDHGECLAGEHGIWYDHHGLYEENTHVPFILRYPNRLPANVRVADTVRSIDIAPTILDLAEVAVPDTMDGQPLTPLIDKTTDEKGYTPTTRVITSECTWQAKWSLRTPTHKFIRARSIDFYDSPERELYDRRADPNELSNIAESNADTAAELEAELEGWIASEVSRLGRTGDPVTEQGREKFAERWGKTS